MRWRCIVCTIAFSNIIFLLFLSLAKNIKLQHIHLFSFYVTFRKQLRKRENWATRREKMERNHFELLRCLDTTNNGRSISRDKRVANREKKTGKTRCPLPKRGGLMMLVSYVCSHLAYNYQVMLFLSLLKSQVVTNWQHSQFVLTVGVSSVAIWRKNREKKKGVRRSHRDLNSDRWIQSPEC